MIRNALIAIYIVLVLAISAVSRAETSPSYLNNLKHSVGPVSKPLSTVDPLPGTVVTGHNLVNK